MTNEEKSAAIAVKIMGFVAKQAFPNSGFYWQYPDGIQALAQTVWTPFTDIAQAMTVAERLRELGHNIAIYLQADRQGRKRYEIYSGPICTAAGDVLSVVISEAAYQIAEKMVKP